ncbi:MAG: glutaredoxin family protein [Candidatus Aenigmatarchaeota archaeon]
MKVKIYTTKTCPYCYMAKQFFKQNNIEFEEVDVSENRESAIEMIEKSGQMGVPVIEIDNKIIVGFNLKEIKETLKLK